MKKLIIVSLLSAMAIGCNDSSDSGDYTPPTPPVVEPEVDTSIGDGSLDNPFVGVQPSIPLNQVLHADQVSFDIDSGEITATVNGKNALNQDSASYVYAKVDGKNALSMYNLNWKIDFPANPHHYVNVYLNCTDTKDIRADLMADGTVEFGMGTDHYQHYNTVEEFYKDRSYCNVRSTWIDGPLYGKGNFIWRSSQKSDVTSTIGEKFHITDYNFTLKSTEITDISQLFQ